MKRTITLAAAALMALPATALGNVSLTCSADGATVTGTTTYTDQAAATYAPHYFQVDQAPEQRATVSSRRAEIHVTPGALVTFTARDRFDRAYAATVQCKRPDAGSSADVEVTLPVEPVSPSPRAGSATPRPRAILTLRKLGPTRLVPGRRYTYRLTVTNRGRAVAPAVYVTDVLPGGLVFATPRRGAVLRDLRPGESRTVLIRVQVLTGASGRQCNRATATYGNRRARAESCARVVRRVVEPVLPPVLG